MIRQSTILERLTRAFDVEGKSKYIDDSRYQVTKDESKSSIFIILLITGVLLHLMFGMVLDGVMTAASRTISKGKAIIVKGNFICNTYRYTTVIILVFDKRKLHHVSLLFR